MTPRGRPKGPRQHPVELVFEAPPENSRYPQPSMYDEVIPKLKDASGRWARIRVVAHQGTAGTARVAFLKRADDQRFEARIAQLEDGSGYGLWARYRTVEQMRE